MNKVILMGRLTRDVVAKEGTGEKQYKMARYTLAVERKYKKSGEQSADFVNCVAYGKNAEFAEKWLKKGKKILVTGHIQTSTYTGRDGNKIYNTDIVIDEQEFAESKAASETAQRVTPSNTAPQADSQDDFMIMSEDAGEDLPFA